MLTKIVLFVLGTTALVVISRKSLLRARSHGFYRFFAWEILLAMFFSTHRAGSAIRWHGINWSRGPC